MSKETETEKKSKKSKESDVLAVLPLAENRAKRVENEERIGLLLSNERKKKDLSLKKISETLKVRKEYLEAIENGTYAELPPLPYSAGFVNSYAKFLGMNASRITQMFKEELSAKQEGKKPIFMAEESAAEASAPDKKYVIISIVSLIALVFLWSFLYSGEQVNENVTYEETIQEDVVEALSVENVSEVLVVEVESSDSQIVITEESYMPEQVENKIQMLEIRITKEDTWVEIRGRNRTYLNKTLRPGENFQLPLEKGMVLSVGKVDTVEVLVDGNEVQVIQPNRKLNIRLDGFVREDGNH